jgi:hypothetical protein
MASRQLPDRQPNPQAVVCTQWVPVSAQVITLSLSQRWSFAAQIVAGGVMQRPDSHPSLHCSSVAQASPFARHRSTFPSWHRVA